MNYDDYEPRSDAGAFERDQAQVPTNDHRPEEQAPYKVYTAAELLREELPKRTFLLGPWLEERRLAMIYGKRGVGKSFLTLSIAIAVASGRSFLDWKADKPNSVLYVDGEMAGEDLQDRVRLLAGVAPDSLPLRFLARDLVPECPFTLEQGRFTRFIEQVATKSNAKLIVLDNLSTLWRGKENDADSWNQMQDWLVKLRKMGRTVLIVHHAGKSGQQRGSSRKEDSLDIVVALKRPESVGQSGGASFNVIFEKSRSFRGDAVSPFHATLREKKDLGLGSWERSPLRVDSSDDEFVAMCNSGRSQAEVAKILGVSQSTVSRALSKARVTESLTAASQMAESTSDEEVITE